MKIFLAIVSILFLGLAPVSEMKSSYGHIKAYFVIEKIKIASDYFEENDEILIDLNIQLENMAYMKASSFIMMHHKGETYLSTSDHVCTEIKDFVTNKKFKTLGNKLLESMSNSSLSMFNDQTLNLYMITPKVFVYDFEGKKYLLKDFVLSKPEKDMCVIKTESVWGKKVNLAKKDCSYEVIYNMSSSGGYYYPNSVPLRQGFMNGIVEHQEIDNKVFKDVNLYTLSVQPGSSGSAVFNQKGEVCGTVNIAYVKVDLSSGNSLSDLKLLFEKIKSTL